MTAQLTLGSGTPLSPILLTPVHGTGITGSLRPDVTGAPINVGVDGRHVNSLALVTPVPHRCGDGGAVLIPAPVQRHLLQRGGHYAATALMKAYPRSEATSFWSYHHSPSTMSDSMVFSR